MFVVLRAGLRRWVAQVKQRIHEFVAARPARRRDDSDPGARPNALRGSLLQIWSGLLVTRESDPVEGGAITCQRERGRMIVLGRVHRGPAQLVARGVGEPGQERRRVRPLPSRNSICTEKKIFAGATRSRASWTSPRATVIIRCITDRSTVHRVTSGSTAHGQSAYSLRMEWGLAGAAAVVPDCDIAVVVDVLSFTTTLTVAADRGVVVYPLTWRKDAAATFAANLCCDSRRWQIGSPSRSGQLVAGQHPERSIVRASRTSVS